MWNITTLQILGIMIVMTGIVMTLTRKFAIPHIVLYLLSGLFLAFLEESFLEKDLIERTQISVNVISEAGISLLLFLVGMELSLSKLKQIGKVAVFAGLGQILFTAVFGSLIGLMLNFSISESLVIGTALTFSSTVVVVKLLGDKKDLNSLYGRIAVGIFLVQDLVVIIALTVLAGISSNENFGGLTPFLEGIGKAFAGTFFLFLLTFAASKIFFKKAFKWASNSSEILFIWSITWCFSIVALAEHLRLSSEIGAFLAGVSLAQLPLSNKLHQRLRPLMNFFICIFFISLGMSMNLSSAFEQLLPSTLFSLFVLIGNPLIFIFIILKFGYSRKTAFLAGVTVAQISEFSFVFAAICHQKGLIGNGPLAIIAFVGLTTIIASSYMILYNQQLYGVLLKAGLLKPFKPNKSLLGEDSTAPSLENHIIVIGMNDLSLKIIQGFTNLNETV